MQSDRSHTLCAGSRGLGVRGSHRVKDALNERRVGVLAAGGGPRHAPVDPGSPRELGSLSVSGFLCLGEGAGVCIYPGTVEGVVRGATQKPQEGPVRAAVMPQVSESMRS